MQGRGQGIWKLNNIIYFWLNLPRPNVVTNKYKHNFSCNWKYLAKIFDTISNNRIAKNNLFKLNLHISALDYLEDRPFHFIEIIENQIKIKKKKTTSHKSLILKRRKKKELYRNKKGYSGYCSSSCQLSFRFVCSVCVGFAYSAHFWFVCFACTWFVCFAHA